MFNGLFASTWRRAFQTLHLGQTRLVFSHLCGYLSPCVAASRLSHRGCIRSATLKRLCRKLSIRVILGFLSQIVCVIVFWLFFILLITGLALILLLEKLSFTDPLLDRLFDILFNY